MNFDATGKALARGYKVRRKGWAKDTYIQSETTVYYKQSPASKFAFTEADIAATDWVIVVADPEQ